MLCWGKKVSSPFRARLLQVAENLETNPDYLACMAFESARVQRQVELGLLKDNASA